MRHFPNRCAHIQIIKRAECQRCGAPKKLPTKTAYIYCDYCAALVDYDFRIANADTNAGITNTVFHRFMAYFGPQLDHYKAYGDRENYGACSEISSINGSTSARRLYRHERRRMLNSETG